MLDSVPDGAREDSFISEREGRLTDTVLHHLRGLLALTSLPAKQDEAGLRVPADVAKPVLEQDHLALPLTVGPEITRPPGLAGPVFIPASTQPAAVLRVAVGEVRQRWEIASLSSLRRPDLDKLVLLVTDSGSEFYKLGKRLF